MTRKIISACLILLLLLTACQTNNSYKEPTDAASLQEEKPTDGADSSKQEDEINNALARIPGGERLLEDDDSNLFLLKEYGFDMKWMEVNQLENLDRGTPVTETESYFLLIPKHTNSQIDVEKIEWDEASQDVVPVETLYRNDSTPQEFGLLVTSNEPETTPNLRVTVQHNGEHASYIFHYDGKGDRPTIQVFPEDTFR